MLNLPLLVNKLDNNLTGQLCIQKHTASTTTDESANSILIAYSNEHKFLIIKWL